MTNEPCEDCGHSKHSHANGIECEECGCPEYLTYADKAAGEMWEQACEEWDRQAEDGEYDY